MKRDVAAELEVEVTAPTTLEFQIAVAPHPDTEVCEKLSFTLDGKPLLPLEISGIPATRSMERLTRCCPAPECVVISRTWWSHC
jgi:hypothetical protein